MSTWLVDPALAKMWGSAHMTAWHRWCKKENPSLFVSRASISLIVAAIERSSKSSSQRREPLNVWFNGWTAGFADRIHDVDEAIFKNAGTILSQMTSRYSRHQQHDAILVATAHAYGHGLVTRRTGVFGPWTHLQIAEI